MTLTGLPIFAEELILTAVIVFITTLIYKFMINQNELREIKQKMKEKQEEAKKLQSSNPEEAKRVMTETLNLSNKQLRMTMKPMMLTLLLFFAFMPFINEAYGDKVVAINNNMANMTIDRTFYSISLNEGKISVGNITCNLPCDEQSIGSYKWNILMENNTNSSNIRFSRIVVLLPFSLPYFDNDFGWFMWYFLTSLILTFVFRKIVGVEM